MRKGAQVHASAGDGGGGPAQLAQRVAAEQGEVGFGGDHDDIAVFGNAVQAIARADGRAEKAIASDAFPCLERNSP